ncbi:VOC family protein [Streptomyces caatingaensis]|uniref:Glyoxalase n=1 Tax=Streptomyces caatingaensis TaxID=1678637 RepID=A0A0K9XF82_9ACTN|nr:VOC family protein [Streptomyces caatingaensis]KNB51898.1 glyoxalase [Streptomyces caatingaensis]
MTPRFDCIGLVVADMPASLAFYRRLGLRLPASADRSPHVEHVLPGGLRLLWDAAPSPGPAAGRVALGFACATTEEVDRVYGELVAAGHTGRSAPWDAVWGQRYAVVLDPDGNAVDLFAPLGGTAR